VQENIRGCLGAPAQPAHGIPASLHNIKSIDDPAVIKKLLEHVNRHPDPAPPALKPFARAPALPELPNRMRG
jgi:hypothetical protein